MTILSLRAAIAAVVAGVALASPAASWTELSAPAEAPILALDRSQSKVIEAERRFSTLVVADPTIAEAMPTSDKSFFVRGISSGRTTLLLYDDDGEVSELIEIVVDLGLDALRADLASLLPGEDIDVYPILDGVFIDGRATTASAADLAVQLAERHVPGGVANGLTISESQQVLLEVRFVEASRAAIKEFGVTTSVVDTGGNSFASDGNLISGLGEAAVAAFLGIGGENVDITLNALEEKGVVRTLAEPNLVALSGDTASFLAGGEFPIPVAAGDETITIEFRQFGVGLDFTPIVLGDGLINLHVRPEVSALDSANAVTISGVSIPALRIRRADTTVELRDGQAFAIAGLLQNDYSNDVRQTPWLANIPVIGALFSSKRFQRSETELVIIITPRLVQPAPSPDHLKTPFDAFDEPSDANLFLNQKTVADPRDVEGGVW